MGQAPVKPSTKSLFSKRLLLFSGNGEYILAVRRALRSGGRLSGSVFDAVSQSF